MQYHSALSLAKELDQIDPLRHYRNEFHLPKLNGREALYLCGNSLGLQPKSVKPALLHELKRWEELGVEGHFQGDMPWLGFHKFLSNQTANLLGAKPEEVVVMNTLTVNLHLMLVSFYRPDKERFKIIMEAGAFPSDQYAFESQVRFRGIQPEEVIVEVKPRPGEETLRTEDIISTIEQYGKETALVMFSGINYYTGQFFDMPTITAAGHKAGAMVGFDLAHAAGNVPMKLHDWGVDFATWCSYKYLNSGPGGPGGVFVHERHGNNAELLRFAGWWGHEEETRFLMPKKFHPIKGAAGWQVSNSPILSFAAHKVCLDMFDEVGMTALRKKSLKLTGYLEFLLEDLNKNGTKLRIISPKNPAERGCQLSILADNGGKELFDYLTENGVVCDWREPNAIRIAPVPFYNSFQEVWRFVDLLRKKH